MSTEHQERLFDIRRSNGLRVTGSTVVASLLLLIVVYGRIMPWIEGWSGTFIRAIMWIWLVGNLIAFFMIRAGKITRGITVSLTALYIASLVPGILIKDMGTLFFVYAIMLSILTSANTLSEAGFRRASLGGIAVGSTVLVVDQLFKDAAFRVDFPQIDLILRISWALAALLIIINIPYILRQFNLFPLRQKLILVLVSVALLSLGTLAVINNQFTRRTLTDEANETLLASVTQIKDSLEVFINNNLNEVRTEASLPVLAQYLLEHEADMQNTALLEQVQPTLLALQGKNETYITSYALMDTHGTVLGDTVINEIGKDKSDRAYFSQPLSTGEPYISPMEISPSTGQASLYFSAPVKDSDGNVIGVLRSQYDASILQDLIARNNGLVGEDSFAVLFDEHLIHLAHGTAPETIFTVVGSLSDDITTELKSMGRLPDLPSEDLFLNLIDLQSHLLNAQQNPETPEFFESTDIATGDRTLQAVAIPLESPPWMLVFFQPQDIFLAPVETQTNGIALISLLIAFGVVGLAVGFSQVLARPILSLTETAAQISQGNLDVSAEVLTEDEIGDLALAFNSMTVRLRELVSGLETQVADRTQDLEKRALMLQYAAETARDASRETELEDLAYRAVDLTAERFNLYHAGLYLMDSRKEYAVLRAGNDDSGRQLAESEHRIRVGSETPVGYVTLIGESRLVKEGDEGMTVTRHPVLPYSKAQMVLPLRVGEDILGALDLHAESADYFDESQINIFRTLADQLAIAIQKTELRHEIEETLQELETAYGRYTRDSWRRFVQSTKHGGYRFRQLDIEPVDENPEEVRLAWERQETVIVNANEEDHPYSTLAVPMKVRDEVVGVINLNFEDQTVPLDMHELMEDIANRLSLVLENARLVEAAQQQVERERLTGEVSSKLSETLDIDAVLRTAVAEIGDALGVAEIEVRLGGTALPKAETGNGFKTGTLRLDNSPSHENGSEE